MRIFIISLSILAFAQCINHTFDTGKVSFISFTVHKNHDTIRNTELIRTWIDIGQDRNTKQFGILAEARRNNSPVDSINLFIPINAIESASLQIHPMAAYLGYDCFTERIGIDSAKVNWSIGLEKDSIRTEYDSINNTLIGYFNFSAAKALDTIEITDGIFRVYLGGPNAPGF